MQRYILSSLVDEAEVMTLHPDGEWVRAEDALALEAENMELRGQIVALEVDIVALEAERDKWRSVAGKFHNALVGHQMAGAFNHRLCGEAVLEFDKLASPDDYVSDYQDELTRAEAENARLKAAAREVLDAQEAIDEARPDLEQRQLHRLVHGMNALEKLLEPQP